MSALVAVAVGVRAEALPPVVRQKIAAFLAAGRTGQIVLDVKEGRVLAYKLTEAGRVPAGDADPVGWGEAPEERRP